VDGVDRRQERHGYWHVILLTPARNRKVYSKKCKSLCWWNVTDILEAAVNVVVRNHNINIMKTRTIDRVECVVSMSRFTVTLFLAIIPQTSRPNTVMS
jgi:hypothetical protein